MLSLSRESLMIYVFGSVPLCGRKSSLPHHGLIENSFGSKNFMASLSQFSTNTFGLNGQQCLTTFRQFGWRRFGTYQKMRLIRIFPLLGIPTTSALFDCRNRRASNVWLSVKIMKKCKPFPYPFRPQSWHLQMLVERYVKKSCIMFAM